MIPAEAAVGRTVPRRVLGLVRTPLVASAAVFGLAGIAFVVATLVYGRLLSHAEFGRAVLVVAICLSAVQAAPAGINALVVRRDLAIQPRLIGVATAAGAVFGTAAMLFAWLAYGFDGPVLAVIGATVVIGAAAMGSISGLQRQQRFRLASLVSQSANFGLLAVAVLMVAGIGREAWVPAAGAAMALALTGAVAWRVVLRNPPGGQPLEWRLWRQGAGFGSLALSAELFAQVDRFLIPLLLDYGQLGIYAVVAAVALAPFRMLEMGALTTLGPRLRAVEGAQRLRLLVTDVVLLAGLAALAGLFLLVIGHSICEYVMPDQEFERSLIIAVVVSGFGRLLVAFAQGTVVAWASPRDLQVLQSLSWLCLAISLAAAWALTSHGLTGVIYGVSSGWFLKAGTTLLLTQKHLTR